MKKKQEEKCFYTLPKNGKQINVNDMTKDQLRDALKTVIKSRGHHIEKINSNNSHSYMPYYEDMWLWEE